jgi:hypothetical protein
MNKLSFTYVGSHWEWSGDLFYLSHPDGREARFYVDSIGETWVDIRRIPEGGVFHTERVDAYRVSTARNGETALRLRGFTAKRVSPYAGRVRERYL